MCNQRKNAIAWANRPVWVHRILVEFLPYYMLKLRTPLLSDKPLLSGQLAVSQG